MPPKYDVTVVATTPYHLTVTARNEEEAKAQAIRVVSAYGELADNATIPESGKTTYTATTRLAPR
jgi:hypothetical protein